MPSPERPTCLAETGLAEDSLSALLLKWLYTGDASGTELADRIRLPYALLEGLLEHARVEFRGASGTVYHNQAAGSNGAYMATGVIPGSYYVTAIADSFRDQWYDGALNRTGAVSYLIRGQILFNSLLF